MHSVKHTHTHTHSTLSSPEVLVRVMGGRLQDPSPAHSLVRDGLILYALLVVHLNLIFLSECSWQSLACSWHIVILIVCT